MFPGIAVGEVLAKRGHDVTLLISEKKIDTLAASGHKELRFEKMPFLAMPKPWSSIVIGCLKGLWLGTERCRQIIRDHDVSVVLGMGGFTSFAPLFAGKKEQCRTLIHESNAIPGKANKLNARYSDIVLCGLEACKPCFPKHPDVRVVGTPIRGSMREKNNDDPHAFFKLDKDKRTLLIMGGSQGARGINRAVGMALEQFEKMNIQVLHIAGTTDYEEVRDVYAKNPLLKQHVAAFCHRMDLAYRNLDVLVPWSLSDYLSMNRQQKGWLDERLKAHLAWHCRTQLPGYLTWLGDIRQMVAHNEVTDAQLRLRTEQAKQAIAEVEQAIDRLEAVGLESDRGRVQAMRSAVRRLRNAA